MFQSNRYEINCNFTKRSISISIKLKLSNVVLHLRMMVQIVQAISSLLFYFYIYYHHLLSNFVPTHISFINWSDPPAACLLIVMFNQVKSWCWRCCDLIHLDYNRQMDMETPGTMGINIITILLLLENVLWIEVMVMQEDVC